MIYHKTTFPKTLNIIKSNFEIRWKRASSFNLNNLYVCKLYAVPWRKELNPFAATGTPGRSWLGTTLSVIISRMSKY